MKIKIVGVVQCKNEWPLIALSTTHALINHVDEVYVLNDSSTDETHKGLSELSKYFKNRLTVINHTNGKFNQYIERNILISIARKSNPDWIYIFDSDEFIISSNNAGLSEILSKIADNYIAVRYNLSNFVSLRYFDKYDLNSYKKLCYESKPINNLKIKPQKCFDMVYNGSLNFFDIPFSSKVIVRNDSKIFLSKGSHDIIQFYKPPQPTIFCDEIYAVHLPLLTLQKLKNKSETGYKHTLNNESKNTGWQNQLLYKIDKEGWLTKFWEKHSISETDNTNIGLTNIVQINSHFQNSIQKTIDFLSKTKFNTYNMKEYNNTELEKECASNTLFSMADFVHLAAEYHNIFDYIRSKKRKRKKIVTPLSRIVQTVKKWCAKG